MTTRLSALVGAGILALVAATVLPFGQIQLAGTPEFAAIYGVTLLITEGATGFLLFDMAVLGRSRSGLLLGCAFFYSALMAVLHVLTFPGALIPDQPAIGGATAVGWLFGGWKIGFAVLATIGVLLRPARAGTELRRPRRTAALAAGSIVLLCLTMGLVVCVETAGPPLPGIGTRFSGSTLILSWAAVFAHATAAMFAAWKARLGDHLCAWLTLALTGFTLELVLTTASGGRFTLGWYCGRLSGLIAACTLFLMFLARFVLQNRAMAAALVSAELRASELQEEIRRREQAEQRLLHAQKIEALGQLAGGVAHDLNNVLQAVQGGASLVARRGQLDEATQRILRMVLQAAERGSAITRRLLSFSRRGDIRTEPVDAPRLLMNMREIMVHTLGAGIGIRVDTSANLPPMRVDKGQLETVLINLAVNARDAMEGNGLLTLSAEMEVVPPAATHVAALDPGSYLRLSVTDTGAGMTQDVLARVTEPFFTTKPTGKGTGLGLAMARGFAEQSGGGLLVNSVVARGTTVTLWFPVSEDAELPVAKPARVATHGPMPVNILLVDDDAVVREIIAEELRAEGYAILTATDGHNALSVLHTGEPVDVLVSDLSMPGMDGLAFIREAQQQRPDLPAVLLTGFASPAAEIAMGSSVSGLLSLKRKPVTGPELAEHLQSVLAGAGMRRGA